MSADYVVKTIPAVRLVARTATLDPGSVARLVGPMFDQVAASLGEDSGDLGVPIASYELIGTSMRVVVGYVSGAPAPEETEAVDLPETTAVCGVHHGSMTRIQEAWQALHQWATENGYTLAGPSREVYVQAHSEDQADWVTELQQPVVSRA